ncbi:MAG TPA: hypothetical protein PKD54_05085 [Pirellulaceae bacterium]|nr:hypothetical protein [Pirellulaceae bacterium]
MVATFLIACVFAAYVGGGVPDVNETYYLTKAKHFWNPAWCAGDLFLESENSHWFFYAITGWLTWFCSLEVYAWIGRLTTWLLLATAWRSLVVAATGAWGAALWTAPLLVVLIEHGHLAGEWVVGGFEAKGISYSFVFWALACGIRGDWPRIWPLLGAATAFHPLVGWWSGASLAVVCLLQRASPSLSNGHLLGTQVLGRWRDHLLPGFAGIALALFGIAPVVLARMQGDGTAWAEAAEVQVRIRLAHHLYFPEFSIYRVAAFAVLLAVASLVWTGSRRFANLRTAWHFAGVSLAFSVVGLCLCAVVAEQGAWSAWAGSLLRLYWFRLADVAVPIAVCLGLASLVSARWRLERPNSLVRLWLVSCIALVWSAFGLHLMFRHNDWRPPADQAALPSYPDNALRTWETYRNWRAVCNWIRQSTAHTDNFLTPPAQQTFKWYAQRPEVFSWKDMPQDDARVVQWWQRAIDVYYRPRHGSNGWFEYTDEELVELAERYDADYLVMPQRDFESRTTRLPLVYPADRSQRTAYVVIRLRSAAETR